jgi:DNA-binding transcriptional ArsR family regulator
MLPRAKASRTDIVFAALANPTRRDILDMLLGGERTVVALAERFDMARPSVSEHLKVLRDCGLVAEHKHGRFRHTESILDRCRRSRPGLVRTNGTGANG